MSPQGFMRDAAHKRLGKMTKEAKMTIEQALEQISRLVRMDGNRMDGSALSVLRAAALEDYEGVKAEAVCHTMLIVGLTQDADALKAEVERLAPYEETYKHYELENLGLRDELERARPLIEALRKCKPEDIEWEAEGTDWLEKGGRNVQRFMKAALAYRESKERANG